MDPLFVANPSADQLTEALSSWPDLAGKRVRPVLVTAFGEIFVETETGEIWSADPLELCCGKVADNDEDFQALFNDSGWAQERLLSEVLLLAKDRGLSRQPDQVFGLAPHPCFSGEISVDRCMPMDLCTWHNIATQLR